VAGAQPCPGERPSFPPVSPSWAVTGRDGAERKPFFMTRATPRHPVRTKDAAIFRIAGQPVAIGRPVEAGPNRHQGRAQLPGVTPVDVYDNVPERICAGQTPGIGDLGSSGDQTGSMASPVTAVRSFSPEPSRFISQTFWLPPSARVKATLLPSGEMAGEYRRPRPVVTGVVCPPHLHSYGKWQKGRRAGWRRRSPGRQVPI
jgi:hypothetical protein